MVNLHFPIGNNAVKILILFNIDCTVKFIEISNYVFVIKPRHEIMVIIIICFLSICKIQHNVKLYICFYSRFLVNQHL